MARPGSRPGDYPGDPLALVLPGYLLYWTDYSQTKLYAQWGGKSWLDSDSRWIKYVDGVIVDRAATTSFTFTVLTPGVLPNIAVVAVPAACDQDGAYDPLFGDATAANLTEFNELTFHLECVLGQGLQAGIAAGLEAELGAGLRAEAA